MSSRASSSFWVLEDTSSYHERDSEANGGDAPIRIRLYRVKRNHPELVEEVSYLPRAEGRSREFKGSLALDLLRRAKVRKGVVVVGARIATGQALFTGLAEMGTHFVAALPPAASDASQRSRAGRGGPVSDRLPEVRWTETEISAPGSAATYSLADLGPVSYGGLRDLRCIALSTGGISNFRRGLIVGVSSLPDEVPIEQVGILLGWARWLRIIMRRSQKMELISSGAGAAAPMRARTEAAQIVADLTARVNQKIARKQDQSTSNLPAPGLWSGTDTLRGRLAEGRSHLNIVELFAGAGGMGLGFLMAGNPALSYRVLFSGELDPVYANTLRVNHDFLRARGIVGEEDVPRDTHPLDLRSPVAMERAQSAVRSHGGVDIVIGGPPCQGFSNANRNSWSSKNPNNKLVETYLDYVVRLRPRVVIMENVQGILWTQKHGAAEQLSVAEHVAHRLSAAGYRIFPKLVDASWYGVPQHRNRFFLLGLHSDLGYAQDEFGSWGPYPAPTHGPMGGRPFTTVRDALADLPVIGNGEDAETLPYFPVDTRANPFLAEMRQWAPENLIWDHVTSRHAEYVIDRYARIPEGGNWSDISDMMTNYSDVGRTHSNIYRRLKWDEPAVTIGHYRKAMLVHPSQNRGLSLREAARLQSFPDWFRFAGSESQVEGGLTYKQQQLGNAVCPLVTRAVAEYLLKL